LAEKWFGPIPARDVAVRNLPQELPQTEERRLVVERDVPIDALFMSYHVCGKMHPDYYVFDMLSDVLSNGTSSRLTQHLVKDRGVFSAIDAYISGTLDPGMLHITGKPADGVSLEQAEAAVREELDRISNELVGERELEKVKNKFESTQIFGSINYLQLATNMAWHEISGDVQLINNETELYRAVSAERLRNVSAEALKRENGVVLYYKSRK
jgi:predicted Zn-dependent peptidase